MHFNKKNTSAFFIQSQDKVMEFTTALAQAYSGCGVNVSLEVILKASEWATPKGRLFVFKAILQ